MTPIELVTLWTGALTLANHRLADALTEPERSGEYLALRCAVDQAADNLASTLEAANLARRTPTPTCEAVPEKPDLEPPTPPRGTLLERIGVDEFFATEASIVFQGHGGLDKEYPGRSGPIEIIAEMLSERNMLRMFKARVEAGVENP